MATLEASGVPGVVVCTKPFQRAAGIQWLALGYPEGTAVAVGHPLGSMPLEQVLAESEAAVDAIIAHLTRPD